MDVTLPDGITDASGKPLHVVQNVPAGTSQADLITKLKANGMNVPDSWGDKKFTPSKTSAVDGLLNTAKNVYGSFIEPAATIASGAVAKPVSDIAGLGAILANATGLTNKDPAQVKQDTQSAMTYAPRTQAGQQAVSTLGQAADATIGSAGRFAGNYYGTAANMAGASPAVQQGISDGMNEFTQQVPTLLGAKLPEIGAAKVADAGKEAVAAAPRQAAIQSARDAGYHLPPSAITGAPAGDLLTAPAGKVQLNDVLSLHNQKVTNGIAKADLGIAADKPLDAAALDKAQSEANAKYEAVRKADQNMAIVRNADGSLATNAAGKPVARPAGPVKLDDQYAQDISKIDDGSASKAPGAKINPEVTDLKAKLQNATSAFSPDDAIGDLNRTRASARANLKNTTDPEKMELGQAQQQAADALEGQISRYLEGTGQKTLFNDFEAARTRLAKIRTVRDAMDSSGNVDAAAINAERNRVSNSPMAGGLLKIADAADSFGNVVRNTQKVQAPAPVSTLDLMMKTGGIGGLTDMFSGSHAAAAGGGAAAFAALLARPASRAFLNSEMYQRALGGVTPSAGTLGTLAANPASPLVGLLAPEPQQ